MSHALVNGLANPFQEATELIMRKAFSNDHVHDEYRAIGTDENMDKRPERTWDYVVLDLPHCLGVAVQSSRLRDRMTNLDWCDIPHTVKGRSCCSKFMVTQIPFAQALGGFQDLVIVNAHLHNEVAKKCHISSRRLHAQAFICYM